MVKKKKAEELVIIGLGPAALSASVYSSRYGIKHRVLGLVSGGQISETHEIDNYLGLPGLSGFEFSQKMLEHAKKYKEASIDQINIKEVTKEKNIFKIILENKKLIYSRRVILAIGTKKRKISIKGEEKFSGKGVSYCATCDGFFYKDKTVGVLGGGDSAAGAAVFLGKIAKKVYIIYRGKELRAEKYWIKLIEESPNVQAILETNVIEFFGDKKLVGVKTDNGKKINLSGFFIEAGSEPRSDFFKNFNLEKDEEGFLKVSQDFKTSVRNIWAAGDITNGSDKFRQVITAASEGAVAARSVFDSIKKDESS